MREWEDSKRAQSFDDEVSSYEIALLNMFDSKSGIRIDPKSLTVSSEDEFDLVIYFNTIIKKD